MFLEGYKNYMTHYIRPRSKKCTPIIFWSRPSDITRLKFPSNQMYAKIYREEEILGDHFTTEKLTKNKRTLRPKYFTLVLSVPGFR